MDPLLALGALSTDVKHTVCEFANNEGSLGDASGLDTGAQDVLIVGEIIWLGNTGDVVEVANSYSVMTNLDDSSLM